MPVFEMPLHELRRYMGRNPKPSDFEAYWERGLRELDSTPPQPEFRPHPSPARFAECFDLWFSGVGGARIHAQYVRPRAEGRHPALLRFHVLLQKYNVLVHNELLSLDTVIAGDVMAPFRMAWLPKLPERPQPWQPPKPPT
jgi:cephalosporin-C deacetylase-like acetyl esterase